jgi:hypothetical protein
MLRKQAKRVVSPLLRHYRSVGFQPALGGKSEGVIVVLSVG